MDQCTTQSWRQLAERRRTTRSASATILSTGPSMNTAADILHNVVFFAK